MLVAHVCPLGSPPRPSWAAGRAVAPARPRATRFPDGGHLHGVAPQPRSFGLGAGRGFAPSGPKELCGLLRREGLGLCDSAGWAWGHRGVMGLPSGLCPQLWPPCALPSSPQPAPTPGIRAGLVCFSSPAPSAQTRKQPLGQRQRLQASAQAGAGALVPQEAE